MLARPLTPTQAAVLHRLVRYGAVGEDYGYAATAVETPSLQALARHQLVRSSRRRVGDLGSALTLTFWWAEPKGRRLAIALLDGRIAAGRDAGR